VKKYIMAYGLWLTGVLTAVAVAYYYYKKVLAIGEQAMGTELKLAHAHKKSSAPWRRDSSQADTSPAPPEVDLDATPIEDLRPPSAADILRAEGGS